MNYNILHIGEKINFSCSTKENIENLVNSDFFIEKEIKLIQDILLNKDIHLVIVNREFISLEQLDNMFEELNLESIHLPFLILGDDTDHFTGLKKIHIFDFVDISTNNKILFKKIKFCYNLYQKELQHKEEMQQLLYIDTLTQLPNRVKLINDVKDDSIGISSLGIIDLNSFKEVNDFFGYRIGDTILKKVVDTINNIIKRMSNKILLYKFSADVYCLANISLSNEDFEEIIIYILGAIESEIFVVDEHEIDIRATAGITFSTKNNKLITANIALQVAKKNNKDYIVFYEALDNFQEYQKNMLWTKKLKHALEQDNIIVYFQPLVNNETMKVDKYECLVRMIDEDKVIAPFFFLEVSKKANQYRNITKIVIDKAFKEFENLSFEFSINVSYEDIEDKNFLNFIKYKLEKYNVASRVVWEILEDEGIKSYDVLFDFIKEVKALGCKVAIDDFGTGYSNFEHLMKMDVDYLKIDASLVKHVATDENSYKVVKTIVEFANSLNLKTIAEYVENEQIFNITKELGANYSQGYHFSAPIEKPNLESFEKKKD